MNTDYVLALLSPILSKARRQFVEFVADRSRDGHQEEFYGKGSVDNRVMGEDHFVENVLERTESLPVRKPGLEAVLDAVKTIYDLQDDDLSAPGQKRLPSEARSMAAWAVREFTDAPLTELAGKFRRDSSSLSAAIRRFELRRENEPECEEKVAELKRELQVAIFQA